MPDIEAMLLYGTRPSRRRAGSAGVFCVVCRAITCWKVVRVRQVAHAFLLPLGSGTHLCDELKCQGCGMERRESPGQLSPRKDTESDPGELAAHTNIDAGAGARARLELEPRLRTGFLTPEQREAMVTEPFIALDFMHQVKCERGRARSITSLLVCAWIILTVLAGSMWLVDMQPGFKESAGFGAAQVGMTVGAIVSFVVVMQRTLTNRRRAAERYVMPLLLRALSAVRPTQEELEKALTELRERKVALARVWDAERLYNRLELVPDPLPLRRRSAA